MTAIIRCAELTKTYPNGVTARHNLMRIRVSAQQTVLSALVGSAIPIRELHPVSQTLEEVYIHATLPDQETSDTRSPLSI